MGTNDQYEQIAEEQIVMAKERIQRVLVPPNRLSINQIRNIIGNYRIAIEPNFISWMQQAYNAASSEIAREVIRENIQDEVLQDHPKMLRQFSKSAGVVITPKHYVAVAQPVLKMWDLLGDGNGITNVAVAATLENTSLVFIPYLAEIGKRAGCSDFAYTDVHGEADIEHAQKLYSGLIEEMDGGIAPWRTVATAVERTASFLEEILTLKDD